MISLPFPALSGHPRRATVTSPIPATPPSPLTGIDAELAQLQAAAVQVADVPELSRLMTQALANTRAECTRLIERDALPLPSNLTPFEQLLEDSR